MRVLSDIGARAVRLVDETGQRWFDRLGDGGTLAPVDIVLFRRLAFAGLAAFLLLPAALSFAVSPVVALPVGAAVSLAVFLLSLAAFFALPKAIMTPAATMRPEALAFAACPGLALILDPQGQVIATGGRDRDLFPAGLREADGLMLAEIVHVSDRIGLIQALDLLRQGASSAAIDVRIERPFSTAGRQFQSVRLDMTPSRGGDDDLLHVFVQARDVSEEYEIRAEASANVAEARSAHEAKSRFLAAVSHELRTPLNAILGFSDVLAGEYFGRLENDRQREYVGLIRQSGAHLLSVVNTMLDMSKIEAGRYELIAEPFVIGEAMEACRAMLDLSARDKGVTLTARTARGLGEVVADRRAVQQILINLAGNAIKFTPAGGVVSIDAVQSGGDLVISISDTGIGIAPEKLEFIGQPFVQIDNAYTRSHEGTGLGLSLVKGLVALHGGRFVIDSRPGEGTVVTVTLPADGSGIEGERGDAGEDKVEFPPRLPSPARSAASGTASQTVPPKAFQTHHRETSMMDGQDRHHARAEAKIA